MFLNLFLNMRFSPKPLKFLQGVKAFSFCFLSDVNSFLGFFLIVREGFKHTADTDFVSDLSLLFT